MPKLFGGADARTAIAGVGIAEMAAALQLEPPEVRQVDGDLYITARCCQDSSQGSLRGCESCNKDK